MCSGGAGCEARREGSMVVAGLAVYAGRMAGALVCCGRRVVSCGEGGARLDETGPRQLVPGTLSRASRAVVVAVTSLQRLQRGVSRRVPGAGAKTHTGRRRTGGQGALPSARPLSALAVPSDARQADLDATMAGVQVLVRVFNTMATAQLCSPTLLHSPPPPAPPTPVLSRLCTR